MKVSKYLVFFIFFILSCSTTKNPSNKNSGSIKGNYKIECESTYNSSDSINDSKIEGYVFDKRNNSYIKNCIVIFEHQTKLIEQKKLKLTDSSGYFNILLPNGKYRFTFLMVGNHKLITKEINLKKNTTTKIFVNLGTTWVY